MGGGGVGGGGGGGRLFEAGRLLTFFCLKDGCLFEVGANSKLGAYSNNYGTSSFGLLNCHLTVGIN